MNITPQNRLLAVNGSQVLQSSAPAASATVLAGAAGVLGFAGDHGQARQALITTTTQAVADSKGNIYFGDGARVRVIMPSGIIETIAGDGDTVSLLGGDATSGSLGVTLALAIDANDNLFVATQNNYIYELTQQAGPLPQIGSGGVVSLFNSAQGLCPGSLFSIYGSNLAASTSQASPPLPQSLDGVTVTLNGKPIPLLYVSPGQINAQIPWDAAPGPATVAVTLNGTSSDPSTINLTEAAPDILQYNGNRAVAVMPDGSLNSAGNPSAAGTYLVLYLIGIGPVDQAVASGAASPSTPPVQASGAAQFRLDGAAIPIAFLGLTPTYVGLGQLNLQVPDNLGPGDHILVLTIMGNSSNSVAISTR